MSPPIPRPDPVEAFVSSRQTTLAAPVSLRGTGLHSATRARVRLAPAAPGHGIVFAVSDGRGTHEVRADWTRRAPSPLCTALHLAGTAKFRTIEHVMASLAAFGVDNARIEVAGQEMPIFDGSARPWCEAIARAGTVVQDAPRRRIRILKPVQVSSHGRFVRAEPLEGPEPATDGGLHLDVTFDRLPAFGVMRWSGEVTRERFVAELSAARSFGQPRQFWDRVAARSQALARVGHALDLERAIQRRQAHRLARSSRPVQSVNLPIPEAESPATLPIYGALHHEKVTSPTRDPVLRGVRPWRVAIIAGGSILGGARYPDEPVRHVALDLVGDLGLAGAPFLGRFVAHCPTHESTYVLVRALAETPDAWTWD